MNSSALPCLRLPAALALLALGMGGCAMNLNEARPARTLRGGEMQVSQVSNAVLATRAISVLIDPAESIARSSAKDGPTTELTDEQKNQLLVALAATSLQGVGYATHLEFGVGLGYRLDLHGRFGNGIYGLTLRRGFELELWDVSYGARLDYNSGESWIPYFDEGTELLSAAGAAMGLTRFDSQLFTSVGREWGEWGRLWLGAKGIMSHYDLTLPGFAFDRGDIHAQDQIWYAGGFLGFALGFRYVFVLAELSVFYSWAEADLDPPIDRVDLSSLVLVPAWGLRINF
ncbi:MAG: hypothetical protein OEZ06_16995 [Myxococcales bacterium]|nr:hypothetical protein [Myxococcales bacterium]